MPSNDPLATFEGCSIVMADGMPCGRPFHKDQSGVDKRPVCIMHSLDTKKSVGDFGENIFAILHGGSLANRVTSRFDFTGFVFPEGDFRRNYDREVVFKNATFTLDANFSGSSFEMSVDFSKSRFILGANFNRVTFKHTFNFSHAQFVSDVDFTEITFNCPAEFSGAEFVKTANFSGLAFSGVAEFSWIRAAQAIMFSGVKFNSLAQFTSARLAQADFSKALFGTEARFIETTFLKRSNFFNAQFHSLTRFIRNTFEENVGFSTAHFYSDTFFWNTTFIAGANFLGAVFNKGGDFTHAVFGPRCGDSTSSPAVADFRDVQFEEPGRVLFHHVNKNSPQGLRIRLLMSTVEAVRFADIHWYGEGDRKMVLQDELDITKPLKIEQGKSESKEKSNEETKETTEVPYEQVAITYRQLINNFEKVRAFDLAEDCWYAVREMKRLNPFHFVLARRLLPYYTKWRWFRWLGERLSFLYLYQKASGYGCSHMRAFEVLLVIVFAFAVAYPVIGLDETIQNRHNVHLAISSISEIAKAYLAGWLHSLEVATFQRSPMYVPSGNLGRLAEIIETILVPIQVSLLLLALRRRFRTGSSSGSA